MPGNGSPSPLETALCQDEEKHLWPGSASSLIIASLQKCSSGRGKHGCSEANGSVSVSVMLVMKKDLGQVFLLLKHKILL